MTRNQRAAALGIGLAFLVVPPAADGTLDNLDRNHTAWGYAGSTDVSALRFTQVVQSVAAVQPSASLRFTQFVQSVASQQPAAKLRITQVVRTYLVLPGETPPEPQGTNPEVVYIRRLRRAPHLNTEMQVLFYDALGLDLETGLGLSSGQGEDPQIMLRYSDDGGKTWSHERWESAGRRGQYGIDVEWKQLGRARDRVFEISMSDPVRWHLLDGFLRVRKGGRS